MFALRDTGLIFLLLESRAAVDSCWLHRLVLLFTCGGINHGSTAFPFMGNPIPPSFVAILYTYNIENISNVANYLRHASGMTINNMTGLECVAI